VSSALIIVRERRSSEADHRVGRSFATRAPSSRSDGRRPERHTAARQFFFVLKGTLAIESEGVRHELMTGEGLEVPPRSTHQVFNIAAGPTDFLVVSQPPSHSDRVLR
jgi:mannose-6-phosphate isomerase-like protein (cupin superfamily)